MPTKRFLFILILLSIIFSCTRERHHKGTVEDPLIFAMAPFSGDHQLKEAFSRFCQMIAQEANLAIQPLFKPSYVETIFSFEDEAVDIAFLSTLSYLIARDLYRVEASLIAVRGQDETQYRSQIIVRNESLYQDLTDLNGQRLAYDDYLSTSGYLLPRLLFHQKAIHPGQEIFVRSHANVILSVYQNQSDAGAIYARLSSGDEQDPRRQIAALYPDVYEKIRTLAYTDYIPNESIVFKRNLAPEMRQKILSAILAIQKKEETKQVLSNMMGISHFQKTSNENYQKIRQQIKQSGLRMRDMIPKGNLVQSKHKSLYSVDFQ